MTEDGNVELEAVAKTGSVPEDHIPPPAASPLGSYETYELLVEVGRRIERVGLKAGEFEVNHNPTWIVKFEWKYQL